MESRLSDKLNTVQRSTRSFCDRELRPIAKEIDQEGRFPWEVVDKMAALGYFGIQAPQELGGAGMDTLAYATVIEEISRVCAAMGLCISVHNSVALFPILKFGTAEQHQRWGADLAAGKKIGAFCLTEPNAGSDAAGIEAVARPDGESFVVNAN
ncbi:MAG: acyl-CoA dehydrogenase family protein, partial [Desulfobacterales bacterium]